MNQLIRRIIRNVAACLGLGLIIGGIAWHDVPAAVSVCGVALLTGGIVSMILARR